MKAELKTRAAIDSKHTVTQISQKKKKDTGYACICASWRALKNVFCKSNGSVKCMKVLKKQEMGAGFGSPWEHDASRLIFLLCGFFFWETMSPNMSEINAITHCLLFHEQPSYNAYCFRGIGGFLGFLLCSEERLIILAPLDQPLAWLPKPFALWQIVSMKKNIYISIN